MSEWCSLDSECHDSGFLSCFNGQSMTGQPGNLLSRLNQSDFGNDSEAAEFKVKCKLPSMVMNF